MPTGLVRTILPARSDEVFALLHDYERRLEWDTLLQAAYLCDGATRAGQGVASVCKGRWHLGGIALKTRYITFKPPVLAAIKMVNRPAFFESFAASIRHVDLPDGTSEIEYRYHFCARPRALRWLLHPVMNRIFHQETHKRLAALGRHLNDIARA